MFSTSPPPDHLSVIDETAWPGVASVPTGRVTQLRASIAEIAFARACARAGLEVDPNNGADLLVEYEHLFARLAKSGWVGLAEGFMAGEWSVASSDALVDALVALIHTNYRPSTPSVGSTAVGSAGEIPPQLVAHFSGDAMSSFSGHFSTGVPTSQRLKVTSYTRSSQRRGQPKSHFVDLTDIGAPLEADRTDLGDAQRRTVEILLDMCAVTTGTHLLDYPSTGGAVAIEAVRRGSTVDSWVTDDRMESALRDRFMFAGITGAAHVENVGENWGHISKRAGHYDAIISVERLETLSRSHKADYLASLGNLIQPRGRIAVQTVMQTEQFSSAAQDALQSLRAYIWPELSYETPTGIAKLVDRRTSLHVLAESRAPEHLAQSLRLQRLTFVGHLREAAADGFDVVYRRLWIWQLALREALARLGMIDCVQLTLAPRNNRGRR